MDSTARLSQAHQHWLDAQREVASLIVAAQHPGSPQDWAEGFRWATRIASIALDWVVEKNDPLHPVLFLQQDAYRKFIVDNPDLNYHFCVLDAAETYRLSGNRGEAPYVGFTFGTDIFHWGSAGSEPTGTLTQAHIDQFELAANGDFEIIISATPHPGNWIKLEPRTQHLAIRETFIDKGRQRPARLHMERLGPPIEPPRLMPDDFIAKLELAASFMLFVVRTCIAMWAGSASSVNAFHGAPGSAHVEAQEAEVDTHCDTDMAYMGARFQLEPGQALKIKIRPPKRAFCYWGLVLVNPWAESYDYRFASTCTNNGRATCNEDGTWHIVIAAEDPGVPNWLDTGGRLTGQMLLRWVLAPNAPIPTSELTTLAALAR